MSLENRYSTMFGSKTSRGRLYGGFYLLIGGIVLGLAALILFFISRAQDGGSSAFYNWREGAFIVGAVAMPLIFVGSSVALPTKTAMRVASFVGLALCAVAVVLLAVHYPENFNIKNPGPDQQDYTTLDTTVYVVGLALMLTATFTSIIGYYLDRLRPETAGEEGEDEEQYGPGYEVPDWVVERDIEYAMKKFGVEVAGGHTDRSIRVDIAGTLGDLSKTKIGGLGKARTIQLDSDQVDTSVAAMTQVRPGGKRAIPGEWADESVAALAALRRAKTQNPAAYAPPKLGFWARVKAFFTGRKPGAEQPSSAPRRAAPVTNGGGVRMGSPSAGPAGPKRGKTIVIDDAGADENVAAAARAKKGK